MERSVPRRVVKIDPNRYSALYGYSLLDPACQPALVRATRVLASTLDAEFAFVGVADRGSVSLTATCGVASGDVGTHPGLCLTTVTGDAIRVIPDTLADAATAGHPLVAGPPHIRFYAGIPLTTSDGFNLGTLCVGGAAPRDLNASERTLMTDVARLLMDNLEAGIFRDADEERYRLGRLVSDLPVAHFTCRLDGTIQEWSPAAAAMLHYDAEQIIGQHVALLSPDANRYETSRVLSLVAARERVDWFSGNRMTGKREVIETREYVYPTFSTDGDVTGAVWLIEDVTELHRLEALVWESRERFEAVADAIHDAVVMTDVAGNVEYLNPPAQTLTGWTTADARGQAVFDVVSVVHEESLEPIDHPVQRCLGDGTVVGPSRHVLLVHRSGRTFAIEDTVTPVHHRDGSVVGTVMVFRQRGAQSVSVESPGYLGNHDSLTGLPNRYELENQLERALVTAARNNVEHVLILLSVPQYTAVQMRQGQVAAGELLKQVAALLRGGIREVDLLARLEDDRFAVLLTHCPMDQAHRIAGYLQDVVGEYCFTWEGRETLLGLRTVLLPVDADVRSAAALLDNPEVAHDLIALRRDLYATGSVPETGPIDGSTTNRAAEAELIDAFATDRFRLYAQKIAPLMPVADGDRIFEFLVHMLDENGRLLSPSVFVGAANRDRLAVVLDRWVVEAALSSLKGQPHSPAEVWTINVSLQSIADETFPDFILEHLDRTGVLPSAICFELSESVAIENLAVVMQFIARVRSFGCRISISQFGTSLHTFAYLRNLHVDYIKIDGSVIRDIADDAIDRAVVGAVGHIAHVMGIQTIAEHVEDIAVLECLKDLGIDYAQGYAVAKPLPLTILS